MSPALSETPCQFGEGGRLLGMLTLPATRDPARPVVVVPNTGVEHRVGPNRLHVQLARALAAAGYVVLRFDTAGLGDSDPAPGAPANASQDLKTVLDGLEARGLGRRYALVGLCSGAHDAHQFARGADERLKAMFFIDGYTYPTPRFSRLLWRARLLHPLRSLQHLIARLRGPGLDAPAGLDTDFIVWPTAAEAAQDFRAFLDRGLSLAFLFTGDVQSSYLYREQHTDVFPELRGRVQTWFLPHIDHTLTRQRAREELIGLVRGWLDALPAKPGGC